jgi:hypothetical protein
MSRILAYTTPGRGHPFPLTPILDELHYRGHQIALGTLASQVRSGEHRAPRLPTWRIKLLHRGPM